MAKATTVKVRKPRASKANHYVNNEKMQKAFIDWYAAIETAKLTNKPEPRTPEYLGECIKLIAENLARSPNFANYSFKEEMIGDGIENSLMYIRNFNPEKYNKPFAYFTQIIYYAFLRRISKEKKQTYIKHKLFINDMTFNKLVHSGGATDEHFDGAKITYDPDKMAALEELFEKKTPKAEKPSKQKTALEEAAED